MDDIRSESIYNQNKSKSTGKLIILIVLILIFIGAIAYGSMWFLNQEKEEEAVPTPTPTPYVFPTEPPTPTIEVSPTITSKVNPTVSKPSPTPSPTIKVSTDTIDKTSGLDRKNLSIEVLNGSGTPGMAKKVGDLLISLGYKVISTGNADSYEYATTEISAKSIKKNFLPILEKDLSSSYTTTTLSDPLTSSSSADARVVVGKK